MKHLVSIALAEDLGSGDVTGSTLFAPRDRARGRIVAKARGVLAGTDAARATFRRLDPRARWKALKKDGAALTPGATVALIDTTARALLAGERTALNFLQRLSGIATLAREFARRARGAVVLDTRKTTPGLRALEKAAVAAGGASNHRLGLFDAAMVKDNHLALAGKRFDLAVAVKLFHARGLHVTVEAKTNAEVRRAVAAGADRVMLDNFSLKRLRAAIPALRKLAPHVEIEVSGGVNLQTVGAIARLRPDFISAGAITHSAKALDLSMDVERL